MSSDITVSNPAVAAAFDSYESSIRLELLAVRRLIFATAAETAGVGTLEETLKWGQPSYLTSETKSGSTIRLAPCDVAGGAGYGVFFTCHTHLVDSFQDLLGDTFRYDGNRAVVFEVGAPRPEAELRVCIAMALTYRLAGPP